jgi:hypothetical protein
MEQEHFIHARTPEQELSQLAVQGLAGYFRSHPPPSERLSQANQVISSQTGRIVGLKPFRVAYDFNPTAQCFDGCESIGKQLSRQWHLSP